MAKSIRQRLGKAIRERRGMLDLTQEEASERAGLSPRYWRAVEVEDAELGIESLEKILNALDWTWRDMLALVSASDEAAEKGTPTPVRRLLDEAWRRATPREREMVTAILKVLSSARRTKS